MDNSDTKEFAEIIQELHRRYKRQPPVAMTIRDWMDDFADWSIADFKAALGIHRKRSEYMPSTHTLYQIRDAAAGILTAKEAWNVALDSIDESKTVVVTDQILEALSDVRHILDSGSPGRAGEAFVIAYDRIMLKHPERPVWMVSLGLDVAQRADVIADAVKKRLISPERAGKLLPHNQQGGVIAGLITNEAGGEIIGQREHIEALRRVINESKSASDARKAEMQSEAAKKLNKFEESRKSAINHLETFTNCKFRDETT